MRKKIIIILVCILLAAVAAIFFIKQRTSVYDENIGIFNPYGWFGKSFALTPENNVMYVRDFKSGECAALCSQPNCTHESISDNQNSNCTAVPPKDYVWCNAFYYDGKIYEIFSATNKLIISTADKDGSDRTEIVTSDISTRKLLSRAVRKQAYFSCFKHDVRRNGRG